jgi:hypothetical protein
MNNQAINLEVGQDKRSLSFVHARASSTYRVTLSKEFLDDNVGDSASIDARKEYVLAHATDILAAVRSKIDGGFAREPFATGIIVTVE